MLMTAPLLGAQNNWSRNSKSRCRNLSKSPTWVNSIGSWELKFAGFGKTNEFYYPSAHTSTLSYDAMVLTMRSPFLLPWTRMFVFPRLSLPHLQKSLRRCAIYHITKQLAPWWMHRSALDRISLSQFSPYLVDRTWICIGTDIAIFDLLFSQFQAFCTL